MSESSLFQCPPLRRAMRESPWAPSDVDMPDKCAVTVRVYRWLAQVEPLSVGDADALFCVCDGEVPLHVVDLVQQRAARPAEAALRSRMT